MYGVVPSSMASNAGSVNAFNGPFWRTQGEYGKYGSVRNAKRPQVADLRDRWSWVENFIEISGFPGIESSALRSIKKCMYVLLES